jgi:hypothetical protein
MLSTTATKSSESTVFDRLYSKSTESSRVRKIVAPVTEKNVLTRQDVKDHRVTNTLSSSLQTKSHSNIMRSKSNYTLSSPSVNNSTSSGGIHDRLYSKGTASYNSKRRTMTATKREVSSTVIQSRGPLRTKTNS